MDSVPVMPHKRYYHNSEKSNTGSDGSKAMCQTYFLDPVNVEMIMQNDNKIS